MTGRVRSLQDSVGVLVRFRSRCHGLSPDGPSFLPGVVMIHIDWWSLLGVLANLGWSWVLVIGAPVALTWPMPGRGPHWRQPMDPWRSFKFEARRQVMERAGGRCESFSIGSWGRCPNQAMEADHIYPHSKRGATIPNNGQALCRDHNRAKSAMTPPWWYARGLEHRRAGYFPPGADVRVSATMSESDWAARRMAPTSRRAGIR